MRTLMIGSVVVLGALLAGCGGGAANSGGTTSQAAGPNQGSAGTASATSGSVTYSIANNSSYDIHYIYISPTSQSAWGPDQLHSDQILRAGATLNLRGVSCDSYDMKLVDEDGDECIQNNVAICDNTTLVIENDDLLRCEGF